MKDLSSLLLMPCEGLNTIKFGIGQTVNQNSFIQGPAKVEWLCIQPIIQPMCSNYDKTCLLQTLRSESFSLFEIFDIGLIQ